METKSNDWGGKRPNSGRKKQGKVQLAVYVNKSTAEMVRAAAKERGCSISEYVEGMLI